MASSAKEMLPEIQANLAKLGEALPEPSRTFMKQFMPSVLKDGALTLREKELISIGMAITSQCDYCIGIHLKKALDAGAKREEIAEVCGVAILMGGGPAMMYAGRALALLEELTG